MELIGPQYLSLQTLTLSRSADLNVLIPNTCDCEGPPTSKHLSTWVMEHPGADSGPCPVGNLRWEGVLTIAASALQTPGPSWLPPGCLSFSSPFRSLAPSSSARSQPDVSHRTHCPLGSVITGWSRQGVSGHVGTGQGDRPGAEEKVGRSFE